jgi:hypothetical protein
METEKIPKRLGEKPDKPKLDKLKKREQLEKLEQAIEARRAKASQGSPQANTRTTSLAPPEPRNTTSTNCKCSQLKVNDTGVILDYRILKQLMVETEGLKKQNEMFKAVNDQLHLEIKRLRAILDIQERQSEELATKQAACKFIVRPGSQLDNYPAVKSSIKQSRNDKITFRSLSNRDVEYRRQENSRHTNHTSTEKNKPPEVLRQARSTRLFFDSKLIAKQSTRSGSSATIFSKDRSRFWPLTIVIVPDVFLDPSCYQAFRHLREKLGGDIAVMVLRLPTYSRENMKPFEKIGFEDDVRSVHKALQLELNIRGRDVIIIGHGYGSLVGSSACRGMIHVFKKGRARYSRRTPSVQGIISLAGWVLLNNQSMILTGPKSMLKFRLQKVRLCIKINDVNLLTIELVYTRIKEQEVTWSC